MKIVYKMSFAMFTNDVKNISTLLAENNSSNQVSNIVALDSICERGRNDFEGGDKGWSQKMGYEKVSARYSLKNHVVYCFVINMFKEIGKN